MTKSLTPAAAIRMLKASALVAHCPSCETPVRLKNCDLFSEDNFSKSAQAIYNSRVKAQKERRAELQLERKNIPLRSETGAKAVNAGFIWERILPCLPTFPEGGCRPLGDPIDHIVFEGLAKLDVTWILFLEIKTGGSRLNQAQKCVQDLVERKRVSSLVYQCGGKK